MANIKSKAKNLKRIERNTERNRAVKSRVKTAINKAKKAILAGSEDAKALVSAAHKEINTAVSKGVLHANNGSRKQARLDALFAKKASK